MALNDETCRTAAIPVGKSFLKLTDGNGLLLKLEKRRDNTTTRRSWLLRYKRPGSGGESMLSLGQFPDLGVEAARAAADSKRAVIKAGIDPVDALRQQKNKAQTAAQLARAQRRAELAAARDKGPTFGAVVEDWIEHRKLASVKETTLDAYSSRLKLLAKLNTTPVRSLTTADFAQLWGAISAAGHHESAKRTFIIAKQVLRFAAAEGICGPEIVVACDVTRDRLIKPTVKNRAAETDPARVGELLRRVNAYKGRSRVAWGAMLLTAYTAQRPLEVRGATWREFDLDKAVWVIPAARYKTKKLHRVPLSRQAVELLRLLQVFAMSDDELVLPGVREGRMMSENTMNVALDTVLYGSDLAHTSHGWRATMKTLCARELKADRDVIELCLGHTLGNAVENAYLRDVDDLYLFDARRELVQRYADYLDKLKEAPAA